MLREAARRAKARGTTASLARADAGNLPFGDGTFAGVVCGGTLNELGDPPRALREARRVLAPNGRLAIMGILKATTSRGRRLQRFLSLGGVRFFEPGEIISILSHARFTPDPLVTSGAIFITGATRTRTFS